MKFQILNEFFHLWIFLKSYPFVALFITPKIVGLLTFLKIEQKPLIWATCVHGQVWHINAKKYFYMSSIGKYKYL